MNLPDFLQHLQAYEGRVPLVELRDLMEHLELGEGDLDDILRFDDRAYQRNLVLRTDDCEVLVLCWTPGQRSPIHDHAQSTCGVRVVSGVATETRFEHDANGYLHPVAVQNFEMGSTTGSQDADIHEISNNGFVNLVTLHVYSPPLGRMRTYESTLQTRDWSHTLAPPALHPAG